MARTKRVIIGPSRSGKIATSRMNKVVQSVHVAPKKDGWAVKQGGKDKVEVYFPRKNDAIKYARELSRARHTGMYVHLRSGKVEEFGVGGSSNPPH